MLNTEENRIMDKDFLITIAGSQTMGGITETISLSTFGEYRRADGKDYITYVEADLRGNDGDTTTLTIDGSWQATLERSGKSRSRLIMEKGRRCICHYDTALGNLMVGIKADVIENQLTGEGGRVVLSYSLDVNSAAISSNRLDITVDSAPKKIDMGSETKRL